MPFFFKCTLIYETKVKNQATGQWKLKKKKKKLEGTK